MLLRVLLGRGVVLQHLVDDLLLLCLLLGASLCLQTINTLLSTELLPANTGQLPRPLQPCLRTLKPKPGAKLPGLFFCLLARQSVLSTLLRSGHALTVAKLTGLLSGLLRGLERLLIGKLGL